MSSTRPLPLQAVFIDMRIIPSDKSRRPFANFGGFLDKLKMKKMRIVRHSG